MKSLLGTFAAAALGLFAVTATAGDTVGKMAYIQSDTVNGGQCINTEYRPFANPPFVLEMKGKWLGKDKECRFGLLGHTGRFDFGIHSGKWALSQDSNAGADANEHLFRAEFSAGKLFIDGSQVAFSSDASSTTDADLDFYLFKRINNWGSIGQNGYGCLLRWCKFTQGSKTVRKFVPWKDSAGTACLYDHATKKCYYKASGNAFASAPVGENDFYYTVNNDMAGADAATTLQVRRGTVDDVEILTMHTVVEKLGADTTVTIPEAAAAFPALKLAEGTLSFLDGKATAMTVNDALTLVGGTTLKIDVVGSACDTFAPASVDLTGASEQNPVIIDINAKDADWSEGLTVISQGVPDDVPAAAIRATQGSLQLVSTIKDGKLIVTQPPAPVAHWTGAARDGNVANPDNWAYTNSAGQAESRVPDANTIVYFVGSLIPNITGSFAAKFVQADVKLVSDCNWSGVASPLAGRIDLQGHRLSVSQLDGDCEITDSTRILPSIYEQLDSIESTGSQYIDTGYVPLASSAFVVQMQGGWDDKLDSQGTRVEQNFGILGDGGGRYDFGVSSGKKYFMGGTTGNVTLAPRENKLFIMNFGTGTMTKSGTQVVKCDPRVDDAIVTFYLFTRRGVGRGCNFLMNWCKFEQGGKVVRDYVPVRELAGSRRIGLFDYVTGEFYSNIGSSDFIPGNVVAQAAAVPGVLYVSNDVAVVNSRVTLSGGLRLVKDGAGTFTAAKEDQGYFGGTVVSNGTFAVAAGGASKCLGASTAAVEVGPGATLELNGNTTHGTNPIVLAGGTVRNSSATAVIGDVTLAADSTIRSAAGACIELAGSIGLGDSLENAEVTVTGEGTFRPTGAAKDTTSVDLVLDSALDVAADITVGDMKVTYAGSAKGGAKSVFVRGIYTPVSGYVNNFVMQNGSAMDFRSWSAALPVQTLSFENNATVSVLPPVISLGRVLLIDWKGSEPSNLDGITFVAEPPTANRIVKAPNGLSFIRVGMMIFVH